MWAQIISVAFMDRVQPEVIPDLYQDYLVALSQT